MGAAARRCRPAPRRHRGPGPVRVVRHRPRDAAQRWRVCVPTYRSGRSTSVSPRWPHPSRSGVGGRSAAVVVSSLAFFVVGLRMPDIAMQLSVQGLYFFALFSAMAWARDRRVALMVIAGVLLLMFGWLAYQFLLGSAVAQINEDIADPNRSRGAVNPVIAAVTYTFLVNIAYFGGAVLGGQAAWNAARRRARLATQAETLRAQAAELKEHAVVEERLRIARELHDVVAHHVSVMGVQAAAARRVLDVDPQAASSALSSVESSAREAVTEMRALLGTLRQGDRAAAETGRAPEPSVDAIPGLSTSCGADGLDVTYSVVADPPECGDAPRAGGRSDALPDGPGGPAQRPPALDGVGRHGRPAGQRVRARAGSPRSRCSTPAGRGPVPRVPVSACSVCGSASPPWTARWRSVRGPPAGSGCGYACRWLALAASTASPRRRDVRLSERPDPPARRLQPMTGRRPSRPTRRAESRGPARRRRRRPGAGPLRLLDDPRGRTGPRGRRRGQRRCRRRRGRRSAARRTSC